jgi:hypothetical protein
MVQHGRMTWRDAMVSCCACARTSLLPCTSMSARYTATPCTQPPSAHSPTGCGEKDWLRGRRDHIVLCMLLLSCNLYCNVASLCPLQGVPQNFNPSTCDCELLDLIAATQLERAEVHLKQAGPNHPVLKALGNGDDQMCAL